MNGEINNSGKRVRVNYTGYFNDGSIFDSTAERDPFEFTCGHEECLAGFDHAVAKMQVGETKRIHLNEQEAYGVPSEENIATVPLEYIPGAEQLKVGMPIYNGFQRFTVVEINDKEVKLDGNHPLAGKALTFDIELLEIIED